MVRDTSEPDYAAIVAAGLAEPDPAIMATGGDPAALEWLALERNLASETLLQTVYERALEHARTRGAENGRAAATWVFDGNTPEDAYRRVLDGIESGDPETLDALPCADLSGQWADSLTGPMLAEWAVSEAVYDLDLETADGTDALAVDAFSELCDAYEAAYGDAVTAEVERAARAHLLR